jgi:hypothetical protein
MRQTYFGPLVVSYMGENRLFFFKSEETFQKNSHLRGQEILPATYDSLKSEGQEAREEDFHHFMDGGWIFIPRENPEGFDYAI